MQNNTIIYIIIGILIIVGGWFMLSRSAPPPLTAIPLSEESNFKATATLSPEQPIAGKETKITFAFIHEDGTPVSDLMVHHARRVHVLAISKDLASVGHIHPSDFATVSHETVEGGVYSVEYTFPKAGRYIVAVDVMSMENTLSQQFLLNVRGNPKMSSRVAKNFETKKCFKGHPEQGGSDRYTDPYILSDSEVPCKEGYTVVFTPSPNPIIAGQETLLRYRFEKDGKPVTDLAPYLDAPIHFAIVPESFDTVLHRHGVVDETVATHAMESTEESMEAMKHDEQMVMETAMDTKLEHGAEMEDHSGRMDHMETEEHGHAHVVPASFGPHLISEPVIFPKAGLYQIFAQVKHEGHIILSSFMVEVDLGTDRTENAPKKTFDLTIENKKITSGPTTFSANAGDVVVFTILADEDEEFHLHGYDKSIDLEAGKEVELTVYAHATGRFLIELEESKTEIGALEVLP